METGTVGMSQSTADVRYASLPVVQSITPTTGQTVSAVGGVSDYMLWMQPVGTLATLTVNFPANASSQLGDIARIGSSKTITVLTLAGAASILNGVSAMTPNQVASFKKVASDTWVLI